ncbi:MAG: hypothetical protein N2557_08590, partial [Hydrogenophilus sp.]|nr:hypothetical protein [Hydrogenophilus sp.]
EPSEADLEEEADFFPDEDSGQSYACEATLVVYPNHEIKVCLPKTDTFDGMVALRDIVAHAGGSDKDFLSLYGICDATVEIHRDGHVEIRLMNVT